MIVGSDFEVYAVLTNYMDARTCTLLFLAKAISYNGKLGDSCGFVSVKLEVPSGEGLIWWKCCLSHFQWICGICACVISKCKVFNIPQWNKAIYAWKNFRSNLKSSRYPTNVSYSGINTLIVIFTVFTLHLDCCTPLFHVYKICFLFLFQKGVCLSDWSMTVMDQRSPQTGWSSWQPSPSTRRPLTTIRLKRPLC